MKFSVVSKINLALSDKMVDIKEPFREGGKSCFKIQNLLNYLRIFLTAEWVGNGLKMVGPPPPMDLSKRV